MKKPNVRALASENNSVAEQRFQLYLAAGKRIEASIKAGFYLEAIVLTERVLLQIGWRAASRICGARISASDPWAI
jgi:hypothetical protein